MAQRRHHYERAFEAFLRARRIPYVAVDEAKKALLPRGMGPASSPGVLDAAGPGSIKSFDFVIYGEGGGGANLLVDVKGRRVGSSRSGPLGVGRLESWATSEDVAALRSWERLFGAGFSGALVFVYWLSAQPADALFHEIFEHAGEWYALRTVLLDDFERSMKVRSLRWGTVDVPPRVFEQICRPLAPSAPWAGGGGGGVAERDFGPCDPALMPIGHAG